MTEPAKPRVLVADDSDFSQHLLRLLLERQGFEVVIADDGPRALALAEAGGFALLVLDLHMPGMHGLQVIERLRAGEEPIARHLPVIALSSDTSPAMRAACRGAGADEFLGKPIDGHALWLLVERLTRPAPLS